MRFLVCLLSLMPVSADWVANYREGSQLLEQGRTEEAIQKLNAALDERPDHTAILDALGRAELYAGRYRAAERRFEQGLRIAPSNPTLLANLAQALVPLGKTAEAEHLLRRVLLIQPENSAVWHFHGQVLYERKQYAEAETALKRALSLKFDPSILGDLGLMYRDQHKGVQALELLGRALVQIPPGRGRARIRANLALLQWERGARAEAEANLRRALEEMSEAVGSGHPDTGWILENHSEVLRRLGRKAEARAASLQAAQIRSAFTSQDTRRLTVDWRELKGR